jgi:hypothetical protein
MKIRNIVGNVPEPKELYGRKDLIEHLWRRLEGNNILLLAPRRFGKTGVMNHVLECPRDGWLPLYLELEDVNSSAEFVWRLTKEVLANSRLRSGLAKARELPDVIRDWVTDTFDEAGFEGAKVKFKKALPEDWREGAKRLMVELEKVSPTVVFIFDELPSMLERFRADLGDEEARSFLAWFRTVRLQRKDRLRRHRFIVGGSIGIDLILRRLGTDDRLNDFERLYVEPLSDAEATRLVGDLADSLEVQIPPDLAPRLLALLGPPVPYFIHMLFSQLAQLPAAKRQPVSAQALDEVYNQRVLGPTCKHYFDHYRTRLARYGKDVERTAVSVLRAVAAAHRVSASALYDVYRKARGVEADDIEFAELVADLQCDWYLELDPHTNEYYFLLPVMRDWWQRWYGKPALKRAQSKKT